MKDAGSMLFCFDISVRCCEALTSCALTSRRLLLRGNRFSPADSSSNAFFAPSSLICSSFTASVITFVFAPPSEGNAFASRFSMPMRVASEMIPLREKAPILLAIAIVVALVLLTCSSCLAIASVALTASVTTFVSASTVLLTSLVTAALASACFVISLMLIPTLAAMEARSSALNTGFWLAIFSLPVLYMLFSLASFSFTVSPRSSSSFTCCL